MCVVMLWNATAHFSGLFLRFRKVCITKLSHFRGSLQCTKNEGLEKR